MTVGLITGFMALTTEFLVAGSVAGLMFFTEPVAATATLAILIFGTMIYKRVTKPRMKYFGQLR